MAQSDTDGWEALRGERPVNEANIRAYRLLAETETRLAQALLERGVGEAAITEAFDRCAKQVTERDDVPGMCAEILALCAAEFGAHLELRAVFPDAEVTLLRDSDVPGRG